jgi:hypothetical protein
MIKKRRRDFGWGGSRSVRLGGELRYYLYQDILEVEDVPELHGQ